MPSQILAIIPARGGSKGIPGKNIKPLRGKPLIHYNIKAALESNLVARVVVSTDDEGIAKASRDSGAEVIMRPKSISGDKASSEDALIHVLNELKQKENYVPDVVVFLQCTSPLTLSEDIDGTVAVLNKENADSAFSASLFYHDVWRIDEFGAEGINHNKSIRPMRQDREEQFLENGAIYVFNSEGFKKYCHRFFGKTVIYKMPVERTLEIDEPYDFIIAEYLMEQQSRVLKIRSLPDVIAAVVMDFDGVFTDNSVYVLEDGREAVRCNRGDGMGLTMLKEKGIQLFVLSKEANPVVRARCKKLGIEVQHNISDKLPALLQWAKSYRIALQDVIYIGNDINDLECMNAVGCSVAVGDAVPEVLNTASIVLKSNGGKGALRELAEMFLARHGQQAGLH